MGDAALAKAPHVVVTLMEEAIQALLLNKPATRSTVSMEVWMRL